MRLILFRSSVLKALQPGERWITVHPNGPGEKGQPVLIQPQPDGSAKVIGGAGGALNHLRLNGVKSADAYKETLKERAAQRRERDRAQAQRDKEAGLHEAKTEARQKIVDQRREAERDFVAGVAQAMGWKPEDYEFDASSVKDQPDDVVAKVRLAHDREMVKKAQEAVKVNRDRLLADAGERAEADIGEVPITSEDPDVLSVQDIDPQRTEPLGLGFATEYGKRAEERGATEEDIRQEADGVKKPLSDAQRAAIEKNGASAKAIRENLETLRDPVDDPKLGPKMVEARKALDLLKMEKKLKLAQRAAREARRKIDASVEEPKALVLEVSDAQVDEQVARDVANDLRTISTRAFLSEVRQAAPEAEATLGRHIGVGAYNSVNSLALAAGGDALVDRSVVDVLGIGGAAEVLTRRLAADLSPEEFKDAADAMEDFHLHHYVEASTEAVARARELQDQAKEMELGTAETGADLTALQEINKRRAAALAESQKVLGTALGEMEANAALVYAMRRGPSDKPFQVSLGQTSIEGSIRQLRAIGLQRGDYSLERVAGNNILSITPEGLDRLSAPVNRSDLEQVRRNLDIINGAEDEEGWLPKGFADRPDLDLKVKPGVVPSFAPAFEPREDLDGAVRDYIGGRTADGDAPADIVSDLQSAEFMQRVGWDRAGAYREVLDRLAPLSGDDGKLHQAEALRESFEAMADAYAQKLGGSRAPIHRQDFPTDADAIEATYRALAAEPTGVAAYKPVGELTPQDQAALRDYFGKNIAKESLGAGDMRRELERLQGQEPEREIEDIFGGSAPNPDWTAWRARRDELQASLKSSSLDWPKYVEAMRSPERAYAAIQDVVRSSVSKGFAEAYNRLKPTAPLKLGRGVIRENLAHLDAVDPDAREARMARERALVDGLRNRVQGRYAGGGVGDRLAAAREDQAGLEAAQMGFFADDQAPAEEKALGADERHTLGHAAERHLAEIAQTLGHNFKPGKPVHMFRPVMSGGKNWPRQRAIKMLEANKRQVLSFGTGSGKTAIGLGGFAHLHQQGKVKRGLFLVPSIAQGGFAAEATRFLEPGKFKWHAEPGAKREDRIAGYKDPTNDFNVVTHQSFREDMLHLGAQHAGVPEEEMSARVAAMSRPERKEWLAGVMSREGIGFDHLNVDEGHDTLNRRGKENSALANVVDAMGDNASYYVSASADPIKNDVSEAFSLLSKMDPDRYTDESAFMRKYGVDSLASKDALRRELARFQYPSKIDPDITATRSERRVPVSDDQKAALAQLDKSAAAARLARMSGKVDVAAMKAISPSSFDGVAEEDHERVAGELQKSLGILKATAVKRIVDGAGAKVDHVVQVAKERPGKQGVVFAHGLDAVRSISERLKAEGLRVATITGKDSARDKAARIAEFRPAKGDPMHDIMVCSDAGATGANLQSGQWLVNYDTPDTAKTHAQRCGRINRIGQKQDVDLIDLVSEHPEEQRRRDRLVRKYALRDALTTPMESLDDTGLAYFLRQRALARVNGGAT